MPGSYSHWCANQAIAAGSETPRRAQWLEQVRSYVADYWAESEPPQNADAVPLRPERIGKKLEQWLPLERCEDPRQTRMGTGRGE